MAPVLIAASAATLPAQSPLATASGGLVVDAGHLGQNPEARKESSFISLVNTTTQMLDAMEQHGSNFAQALANLNIVYDRNPTVDVQTSTAQRNDNATTATEASAIATGILRFQSRLLFRIQPPFFDGGYPVNVRVPYAMSNFETANAVANVRLLITDSDGVSVFHQTMRLGVDPAEGEFAIDGIIEPNSDFELTMEANASSRVPVSSGGAGILVNSEAQAVIGAGNFTLPRPTTSNSDRSLSGPPPPGMPFLRLDQEAFDAIHGENSYDLNEYLYFDYSPNLIEPLDLSDLDLAVGREGDQVLVTFDPVAGINHTVEVSDSLADQSWNDLPEAPHNDGSVSDTVGTEVAGRFYRVRSMPE